MTISDLTNTDAHDNTMDDNTSLVVDQPALAIAQAPSFCRLCNVELRGLQTWRAHIKTGAHVYKLRLKVAEPGSTTSPPPSPPLTGDHQTKSASPSCSGKREEPNLGADKDQTVDSDDDDEPSASDFDPGRCLFCTHESDVLGDNMTHMAAAHSFTVPFQDFLAVDLEAVVWYFQFSIYGYRECICCGTRRSTVEGIQHHMVAKGHCRFDLSPDTEEFYEIPQSKNVVLEQTQRDASIPVRLPSGKLISQRRSPDTQEPRAPRRAASDRNQPSFALPPQASTPGPAPGHEVARRGEGGGGGEIVQISQAKLAAQLSKLRIAGDRVQQKVEARKRGRMEQRNNTILMKHFILDAGDSRIGRRC